MTRVIHLTRLSVIGLFFVLSSTSCMNQGTKNPLKDPNAASAIATPTPTGGASTGNQTAGKTGTLIIGNATVSANAGAISGFILNVSLKAPGSSGAVSGSLGELCKNAGGSAILCRCRYTWTLPLASSSLTVTRSDETDIVSNMQNYIAACPLPYLYSVDSEIPVNTPIQVSIVAGGGNPNTITSPTYQIQKTLVSGISGAFQDSTGRPFVNISHYSCVEKIKKGKQIDNLIYDLTLSSTGETKAIPVANKFCMYSRGQNGSLTHGQPSGGQNVSISSRCENVATSGKMSSQAYAYNLYMPSDAPPYASETTNFVCPKVSANPFPGDTTFSLSKYVAAPEFTVPVDAYTCLYEGASGACQPTRCDGTRTADAGGGIASGCLGFAARPSDNGSCPALTLKNNTTVPTYRLRRYFVAYPQAYDADGRPLGSGTGQSQLKAFFDWVYVLDRPVYDSSSTQAKYMMRGPKPCPYAFFDKRSKWYGSFAEGQSQTTTLASGERGAYASSFNKAWTGKNIDGTQFPNFDFKGNNDYHASCAMSVIVPEFRDPAITDPVPSTPKKLEPLALTLGTLTDGPTQNRSPALRKAYVRPYEAFATAYQEDTTFKACAPEPPSGRVDPPILTASSNGGSTEDLWCAQTLPSVSSSGELDTTSTSGSTPSWSALQASSSYGFDDLEAGLPLTARTDEIVKGVFRSPAHVAVQSLQSQRHMYSCDVTYDENGAKSVQGTAPSDGCCKIISGKPDGAIFTNRSNCGIPNY